LVFERFTRRARQVVVLAQDEARDLRHDYIGTEHIVLGLIREEDGLAARTLDELRITAADVRGRLAAGTGERRNSGQIMFLPPAKRALEAALEQADAMKHRWIGTEHLLLGLVADHESVGSRILGVPPERVRERVLALLRGERPE
jgi:ATP-dependent Clp protease ATP-binding subunit ClpC